MTDACRWFCWNAGCIDSGGPACRTAARSVLARGLCNDGV